MIKDNKQSKNRIERVIYISKWARLIIACIGLTTVGYGFIEWSNTGVTEIPVNQIGSVVFAFFALLLGFEYRVAGKRMAISMFLMLYGIIMIIMTLLEYFR